MGPGASSQDGTVVGVPVIEMWDPQSRWTLRMLTDSVRVNTTGGVMAIPLLLDAYTPQAPWVGNGLDMRNYPSVSHSLLSI
jgi:hypothetical protein